MMSSKLASARKPSASAALRVEVARPAVDDAHDGRVGLTPDQLHRLLAGDAPQRLDLLADRRAKCPAC